MDNSPQFFYMYIKCRNAHAHTNVHYGTAYIRVHVHYYMYMYYYYYFISLLSNSKTHRKYIKKNKIKIIKINKCGDGKTEEELLNSHNQKVQSSKENLQ